MSVESQRDPREVLAREKFFSVRPRPLEKWLWQKALPPSAERVFWLHWQAGSQSRDWCSAIPLKAVAAECALDVSSVTRAYQMLTGLGLIRRQDPGRDPERPFQQAVAVTEVRLPRELVQELERYPNRRAATPCDSRPIEAAASVAPADVLPSAEPVPHLFAGMRVRERLRAIAELLAPMSVGERRRYDEAAHLHRTHLEFDADTKLSPEQRARVLEFLALMVPKPTPVAAVRTEPGAREPASPKRLSPLELARLRRELQAIEGGSNVEENFRQIVWSVEEGALRRFTLLHAVRIALKKVREGQWTRPHRMPPQWSRVLSRPTLPLGRRAAPPESCTAA